MQSLTLPAMTMLGVYGITVDFKLDCPDRLSVSRGHGIYGLRTIAAPTFTCQSFQRLLVSWNLTARAPGLTSYILARTSHLPTAKSRGVCSCSRFPYHLRPGWELDHAIQCLGSPSCPVYGPERGGRLEGEDEGLWNALRAFGGFLDGHLLRLALQV